MDFNKINYEIDSNLVRGLDYYNKTAFEFVSNEIGAQSAIAGGGRYDRLLFISISYLVLLFILFGFKIYDSALPELQKVRSVPEVLINNDLRVSP